jgi:serine/threonine protein kinase
MAPSGERKPFAQSGLSDAVQAALGASGALPSLDSSVERGGTIHLGAEYLAYARSKLSPLALKKELEQRLAPVVATSAGPVPGQPFGKFQVERFLGKGGMAEVFLALDPERDPARGQEVALKVMREDIAGEPTYIRRFLREAANAGLVDHPNVVSIYEVGAVRGRVYFTMELVQGQTLKERLATGALEEKDALEILRQIASGLVAAHARGIGHRDLKPSNIMLADPNRKYGFELQGESAFHVKLMDFGLARQYTDDDEPEADAEGRILGTAKYVAPELIEGKPPTLQADVFSLGIMAFQMFSGRAPWKAKNKLEYLEANLRSEAPQLDAIAQVTPETSALVAAMLDKEPLERPTTEALVRDLERLIARTGPVTVRDDPTSIFFEKRKKRGARSGARPLARTKAPVTALVILGAVVVALGLTALLLAGGSHDDRPPAPPPPPHEKPPEPPIPPHQEKPKAPKGDEELVLGRRPRGLEDLIAKVPGPLEKSELKKKLDSGDQAWAESDPEYARDRWREALLLASDAPEVKRRVRAAEREVAIRNAVQAEKDGRTQDALDALDEAEQKGAPASLLDLSRGRLRSRLADERTVQDALDEATACIAKGDVQEALSRLAATELAFVRLGRDAERQAKIKEANDAQKKHADTARLDKLLDDASACLARGELETARARLEAGRAIDANDSRIPLLDRRIKRQEKLPKGFACIELAGNRGLYVRRAPVTNQELKNWIDALPPGKRRSGPWLTGDFPAEAADQPVKNVKPDDARAFAESRGERLPTTAERDAIARSIPGATSAEGVPDTRGTYPSFRTVLDPPGERP